MSNIKPATEVDSVESLASSPSSEFPLVVSVLGRRAGWRRLRGSSPVDLSAMARVLPEIAQALRAGEMVRIIGSSELLEGIKNGALHYMQGDAGHFEMVLNGSNRIVGHVQLESATELAETAKAMAVFQVASAVTLQYYLQRIDERLEAISIDVRKAREHAAWAPVARAALELPRFAEELRSGSPLAPGTRSRLDIEERACDLVAIQELLPVGEAVAGLATVHREIQGLSEERAKRGALRNTASSLVETMPGGVRGGLVAALGTAEEAMVHWRISCAAAHVHASLASLQMVDDELAGRRATSAALGSMTARAEAQRSVAQQVGELLALPAETWSLFTLDGGVARQMRSLDAVALVLQGQSRAVVEKLDLITQNRIGELVLTERNGKVVALKAA